MQVLRARPSDIPWIAEELRAFTLSLNTKHSYIPPTQELTHRHLCGMADNHVLLVAEDDGKRIGTIGGLTSPHPFNPDIRALYLAFWWVPEENRGSRAGHSLLREFLKIGESFDMVSVSFMDTGLVNPKTFDKMGFSFRELTYVKENQCQSQQPQ